MFPIRDSVPARMPPFTNWALIALCVVVFFLETRLDPETLRLLFLNLGLVPAGFDPALAARFRVPPFHPLDLVTSQFLHGGWGHLIGNMWVLWIFGDNVEDRLGSLRYLWFYLFCGVIAGLVHAYANPLSPVPTIGASGAIAGVMGAYLRFFPRARIVMMIPLFFLPFFFEVPAFFFLGWWFLEQVFQGGLALLAPNEAFAGVAWWAHVGGFAAGWLLAPLVQAGRPAPRAWQPDEFGFEGPWGGRRPLRHRRY